MNTTRDADADASGGYEGVLDETRRLLAGAASRKARELELVASEEGLETRIRWDESGWTGVEKPVTDGSYGRLLISTILSNTNEAPTVLDVRAKSAFTIKGSGFLPEGVEKAEARFERHGERVVRCTVTFRYTDP